MGHGHLPWYLVRSFLCAQSKSSWSHEPQLFSCWTCYSINWSITHWMVQVTGQCSTLICKSTWPFWRLYRSLITSVMSFTVSSIYCLHAQRKSHTSASIFRYRDRTSFSTYGDTQAEQSRHRLSQRLWRTLLHLGLRVRISLQTRKIRTEPSDWVVDHLSFLQSFCVIWSVPLSGVWLEFPWRIKFLSRSMCTCTRAMYCNCILFGTSYDPFMHWLPHYAI